MIENIFWILADFHYVNNDKKVSMKNDLETPAYVIRGKDKDKPVLTVFEDKIPSVINIAHYYQISLMLIKEQ